MLADLALPAFLWFLWSGKDKATKEVKTVPPPVATPRPAPAPAPVKWPAAPPALTAPQPAKRPVPHAPPKGAALPPTIPWAPMPVRKGSPPVVMKTAPVTAPRWGAEQALKSREKQPLNRSYWKPAARPTPGEVQYAVHLLKSWKPGCIHFYGPMTWAGRKQYRCAMHGQKHAIEVWEPAPPFS